MSFMSAVFLPNIEAFRESAFSTAGDFSFTTGMVSKYACPFSVDFIFGYRKKAHRAKSGKHDSCGSMIVLFEAKYRRINSEKWAGALSLCKIQV